MQELLRRLAEQVVNAVMDAEADQLRGGVLMFTKNWSSWSRFSEHRGHE